MMKRSVRNWVQSAIAVPVVLTLASCAAAPEKASVIPTPTLVVEHEATSPLEANRYVRAARAFQLGYEVAANNQDFTIRQFTSTRSVGKARAQFNLWNALYVKRGASPQTFPGPAILLPLSVTENATGDGATIEFCDASGPYVMTEGRPRGRYDLAQGRLTTWTMKTNDGVLEVANTLPGPTQCDATGAPVWRYDPVPVRPTSIKADDVRAPLGVDEKR